MLTVDELLSFTTLETARPSPDGSRVAFVVTDGIAGLPSGQPESRVWLVDTAGGEPRQLTHGPGQDTAPAWSPEGRTLAFLSDRVRRDTARLHLLPLDGGEARALDTPPGAVKSLAWSPDGRQLAFVRTDRPGDPDASQEEPDANAPLVFEEAPCYDRVWLLDLASGATRPATTAPVHTWELASLPDASALVAVVADGAYDADWYACRLARLDLATGDLTTIYTPPAGRQVARPAASPDGRLVACVTCGWSDPGMSGGDLLVVPVGGGEARNLTPDVPFSVNTAHWLDAATLLYDAYDDNETSVGLARLTVTNGQSHGQRWQRLWRGSYSLTHDGIRPMGHDRFVAVRTNAREPHDVWLGEITGDTNGAGQETAVSWRQLTHCHPRAADLLTASWEDTRWTAADGLALGGLLMRPPGTTGPTPLVVLVHGGPAAMASPGFGQGLQALGPLLAARGIATFMPNYRGSNGRGVAFAEANRGDMGGADYGDIIAGVDHLVATGSADPARLAIVGWSYGGFMTMWALTQTTRFKAGIAGAGVANWLSFHGGSILHVWDCLFFGADPYEPDGIYARRSAIRHMRQVETPVLLLHGDADRDVPPDQSREYYRALKDLGKKAQLVLYPGAAHGPHDARHRRDIVERGLAWLTERLD